MYFQANIDYVIENYCINKEQPVLKCNGKCHLKKQLSVFSQTDQEKKTAALSQIAEAFYPIYFQESGLQYSLLTKTYQQNVFASTQNLYKYSYLNKLLKPPMVSFYNTQLS